MKRVIVRADGNKSIGMGHLMRMLAIADQMDPCMASISFVLASESGADLVKSHGYEVFVLSTDPSDMDGELPELLPLLDREAGQYPDPLLLLLDSYFVTDHYIREIKSFGKVFLMDDLMRDSYPVDGVINYNVFAEQDWYALHYPDKLRWIGPAYVPLRPEFTDTTKADTNHSNQILITTGGGDQEHIGAKILYSLYCPDYIFHVILGNFSGQDLELEAFAARKENIILHHAVDHMAELMSKCMLGITAGGSTVYEMCAMKLPFLVFSYAENQEALAEYIGEAQAGYFAGAYHKAPKACLDEIKTGFELATGSPEHRMLWRENASGIVDGLGAKRLADGLLKYCNSPGNVLR